MESLRGTIAACAEWPKGVPFFGINSLKETLPRRAQRAAAPRCPPSLHVWHRGILIRRSCRSSGWSRSACLRLASFGLTSLWLASTRRPLASRTAKLCLAAPGCACLRQVVLGLRASPVLHGLSRGPPGANGRGPAPWAAVAWRDLASSRSYALQLEMESLRGTIAACAEWPKGGSPFWN